MDIVSIKLSLSLSLSLFQSCSESELVQPARGRRRAACARGLSLCRMRACHPRPLPVDDARRSRGRAAPLPSPPSPSPPPGRVLSRARECRGVDSVEHASRSDPVHRATCTHTHTRTHTHTVHAQIERAADARSSNWAHLMLLPLLQGTLWAGARAQSCVRACVRACVRVSMCTIGGTRAHTSHSLTFTAVAVVASPPQRRPPPVTRGGQIAPRIRGVCTRQHTREQQDQCAYPHHASLLRPPAQTAPFIRGSPAPQSDTLVLLLQ